MALRDILIKFGVDVDQTQLLEASNNVNALVIQFNRLQRIAGFAMAALGAGQVLDAADQWIGLQNRLRAVTSSTQEFEAAQKGVIDVARKAYTPIEDVAQLYQRYTMATKSLGVGSDEVLDFTNRLIQASKIGGSSAQELRGALIQLGQGMATDFKAGGQELNSILEQAPKVAMILADALKTDTGHLKEMAQQGKLTGKAVFDGLRKAGPELDKMFASRDMSFEDLRIRTTIEWMMLLKQILPWITKLIRAMSDGVEWMREWVENGGGLRDMMSALIVVVIALTTALGPLAIEALLVAAPFIALFLVLSELIGFMQGHDSLIGRFFNALLGEGGEDKAREALQRLLDALGEFVKWLTHPSLWADTFSHMYDAIVAWFGKAFDWIMGKIPLLGDAITQMLRDSMGNTAADFLGIPKAGQRELERGYAARNEAGRQEYDSAMNNRGWEFRGAKSFYDTDEYKAAVERAKGGPQPDAFPWVAPRGGGAPATVNNTVTNNVTVTGNATPETARKVAQAVGTVTAGALGRDRSAIGAGVGVTE